MTPLRPPPCLVSLTGALPTVVTPVTLLNLEDADTCGFGAGSWSSTDPGPLELADNGGGTETLALSADSPALDRIPVGAAGCGTTVTADQRGVARPRGEGCDVGAYER